MSRFEDLLSHVRVAARSLLKNPGYSLAFTVTLGLGIGANSAIFSVVNGVLLTPLPYPDADRILYLRQPSNRLGVDNFNFSFVEIADYRSQVTTIDEIVEFGDWTYSVVGEGEPHRANGGLVTSNFFEVLDLHPALGRTLQPSDDTDGAAPVAVLTHEYWQRVFGGDSGVVGRTISLGGFGTPQGGKLTEIVGVLEPGSHYAGGDRQDFYVNYTTNDHYMGASMQDERNHRMTDVLARMNPGVDLASARAELEAINARLGSEYPDSYERFDLELEVNLWRDVLTEDARSTLWLLLGTVAVVLVIACANVGNLTLTRLLRRERELAIRAALGAGASHIRWQILTETLLLSLTGAALGVLVAAGGLDLLVAYSSRFTFRTGEIGLDLVVLAFTLVLAVGAAVLLAWLPGLRFVRDLADSLQGAAGGRSVGGHGRSRLQRGLVVSQVGASFVLLVGAGLLVRSLVNLAGIDPGFQTENVVTLEARNFTRLPLEQNNQLMRRVAERTRHFPGVRAVAWASWAPFQAFNPVSWNLRVEGSDDVSEVTATGTFNTVSASYFDVIGLPIVQGRGFGDQDHENSVAVVVINESVARTFFPDGDAIGRRIAWSFGGGNNWSPWQTVVGVAADSREYGLASDVGHTIYRSAAQLGAPPVFLIRTVGEKGPLVRHMTEVVHEMDAGRPVDNIRTLEELQAESMAPWRLNASLFGAFAALAMVIAAVGIGGVLAFSVSRRTNEIGVRMTFGANRSKILRMILREGAVLAGLGILLGVAVTVPVSRLMAGLLYGVAPTDPITYVGVAAILGAVAITASAVPALRATRVDPMEALRVE